jgi:hypothetical protein
VRTRTCGTALQVPPLGAVQCQLACSGRQYSYIRIPVRQVRKWLKTTSSKPAIALSGETSSAVVSHTAQPLQGSPAIVSRMSVLAVFFPHSPPAIRPPAFCLVLATQQSRSAGLGPRDAWNKIERARIASKYCIILPSSYGPQINTLLMESHDGLKASRGAWPSSAS